MADVFLSYAMKDREHADALTAELERAGLSVWRDVNVVAGDEFEAASRQSIEEAKVVVVLLSEASQDSKFVALDVTAALAEKKIVVPVLIDEKATRNYVWPLIADRLGIRLNPTTTLRDAAEAIATAIHAKESVPELDWGIGRSGLTKLGRTA